MLWDPISGVFLARFLVLTKVSGFPWPIYLFNVVRFRQRLLKLWGFNLEVNFQQS